MTTFASFQNTTFDPICVATLPRLGYGFTANVHDARAARQDGAARAALPRLVGSGVTLEIALLPVGEEPADRTHPLATASISLHL